MLNKFAGTSSIVLVECDRLRRGVAHRSFLVLKSLARFNQYLMAID
ncbi:hypothetical protein [Nostoc sp.]